MKKSLVITTIATVLVIVVALTTATFAWFSASDTTKVTSSFSAQAADSSFRFYRWNGAQNSAGSAYETTASVSLDFTDVANDLQSTTYAFWNTTEMRAFMPSIQINTETPVVRADDATAYGAGVPASPFYTANSDNQTTLQSLTLANYTALVDSKLMTPNVARFKLENGKNYPQAVNAVVTVKPVTNDADKFAADSLRFLIIAKASNDDVGFVFGTTYSYGLIGSAGSVSNGNLIETDGSFNDAIGDGTVTGAKYNKVEATADGKKPATDNTNTDYYVAPQPTMKGQNTTYNYITLPSTNTVANTDYTNAKLANGGSYEIYLYVWFEGSNISNTASLGVVEFTIQFTGSQLTTGA